MASVLHLGNIQFEESEDGPANIADFTPVEYISQVRYTLIYIDNILFKYTNVPFIVVTSGHQFLWI